MTGIKGYKVFNPDWTCRGFKYKVGETYKHTGDLGVCKEGFHFCKNLSDCFSYYSFDMNNKVAEVVAEGKVITEEEKSVTNILKIVKELTWEEVFKLVNTGNGNAGYGNTGDRNTGNRNTGDRNVGNYNTGGRNTGDGNTGNGNAGYGNTGDRNTGNRNTGGRNTGDGNTGNGNAGYGNAGYGNTGNRNTGSRNTGDRNTGYGNTGDFNTGDRNTGLFNSCNYSNGLFNSKSPKIYMFNKPTKLTYEEFQGKYPEAYNLLYYSNFKLTEWILDYNMTEEEKIAHPGYETTGGYLKVREYKECFADWWKNLKEEGKQEIRNLPNFDAKIFEEITGIDITRGGNEEER